MNSSPIDQPSRAHNQLVFADLTDYPVMAQALDNQWLPAALAADRQRAGAVAGAPAEAVAAAAAEFRRALVNSGTLVVNRAFFLNNEAIYANYLPTADPVEHAAFAKLLTSRALVPYLYTERSAASEFTWGHDRGVFQAWSRMVNDESDPALVRFDWDDARNADTAGRVSQFFSSGLLPLIRLQVPQLARDLGIPEAQAHAMRAGILKDISTWALQQDPDVPVTRNALYKEFITRPGSDPYESLLRDGEHVLHAKQLIDLLYNIGVPLIADSPTPLTPPDSPRRTALQELRRDGGGSDQDPGAVAQLLRGLFADDLHRAVDGPNSYAGLSLDDITRLRRTEEWRAYIDALDALVRQGFRDGRTPTPEEFAAGTAEIARRHAQMLRAARKGSTSGTGLQREIVSVLVIESAGVSLQIAGGEDISLLSGSIQLLGAVAGALTMRLEFRDRKNRGLRGGLGHSLTFPTRRLGNLRSDWEEILRTHGRRVVETGGPATGLQAQADQQPEA